MSNNINQIKAKKKEKLIYIMQNELYIKRIARLTDWHIASLSLSFILCEKINGGKQRHKVALDPWYII